MRDPAGALQGHALQFIGLLKGVHEDGRNTAELDSGEVAQLQTLVATGHDKATEWAQNILCFGYGICRPPLSGGKEGTQKSMGRDGVASTPPMPLLRVFPNPASSYATFAYDLKKAPEHAYITVRDVSGRELKQFPIAETEGQALWDTRRVAPGTYTVELVSNGITLGSSLLVVRQ